MIEFQDEFQDYQNIKNKIKGARYTICKETFAEFSTRVTLTFVSIESL